MLQARIQEPVPGVSHVARLAAPILATAVLVGCASHKVEPEGPLGAVAAAPGGKPMPLRVVPVSPADEALVDPAKARSSGRQAPVAGQVANSKSPRKPPTQMRAPKCSSPMLSFLTLGIIPAVCEDHYVVLQGETYVGQFQATSMTGWAAVFLNLTPAWHMGNGDDTIVETIRERVAEEKPSVGKAMQ